MLVPDLEPVVVWLLVLPGMEEMILVPGAETSGLIRSPLSDRGFL